MQTEKLKNVIQPINTGTGRGGQKANFSLVLRKYVRSSLLSQRWNNNP